MSKLCFILNSGYGLSSNQKSENKKFSNANDVVRAQGFES